MKFLLLFLTISLFAGSPFHTEIVITSEFGAITGKGGERRPDGHKGLDCHAKNFYPVIYSIMSGTVTDVDINKIYGKYVEVKTVLEIDKILLSGEIITAGTIIYHKYSHGKTIFYSASGNVDTNTPLMLIGQTGYTGGIHLDLEIYQRVDNKKIYYDPEEFI